MFPCPHCKMSFQAQTQLIAHRKETHSSYRISADNVQHEVHPDAIGRFTCPLPHHPQPTVYQTQSDFRIHYKVWKKLSRTISKEEAFIFLTQDLIDTLTLRGLALVFNVTHKLVICTPCGTALLPSSIANHLTRIHAAPLGPRKSALDALLVALEAAESFPEFDETVVPEIQGLPVQRAFACTECPSLYGSEASMMTHFSMHHPRTVRPLAFPSVDAQALKKRGTHAAYFRVERYLVDAPLATDEELKLLATAMIPSMTVRPVAKDARNVTPWLRATRWHELVDKPDVNVAALRQLASHPTTVEFRRLQPAVLAFLCEASELIDVTPTLVLQRLNSDDANFHITNKPFHHFQDHLTRLKVYMLPLVDLLAMLLRRPAVPLPEEVRACVDRLSACLPAGSDEEIASSMLDLLKAIWMKEWLPTKEHRITDPTILYLVFWSLEENRQFKHPREVTPVIAKMEYSMRLVRLCLIHDASSLEQGLRDTERWFSEKQESTFNALRTLQHLATAIAMTSASLPRIWWLDRQHYRSFLYKGDQLELRQIQAMVASLEHELVDRWEQRCLFGKKLRVDYDLIKDDLSNTEPGYCFLTDPRNTCFSDPSLLVTAILEDSRLKAEFIQFHQGPTVIWNPHRLRQWLSSYSSCALLLILIFHMTAGASSRVTELVATLLSNTEEYPIRNLIAFGPFVSIMVTYLKTSSLTGVDRQIPHALGAFSADLLVQYLAVGRPFACLAASHCFTYTGDEVLRLYQSHIFVNLDRIFTTTDVTEAMKLHSAQHFGFSIGVSDWRHIGIALRRVLAPRLASLVDGDEEDTPLALQSGHGRQVENRVYGLTADTLRGASEDVLPLYLTTSTDWQIILGVVPGGIGLTYTASTMASFQSLVEQKLITLPSVNAVQGVRQHVDARLDGLEAMVKAEFGDIRRSFEAFCSTITAQISSSVSVPPFPSSVFSSSDRLSLPSAPSPPYSLSQLSAKTSSASSLSLSSTKVSSTSSSSTNIKHSASLCLSDGYPPTYPSPASAARTYTDEEILAVIRRLTGKPHAQFTCPEQKTGILAALALREDVVAVMATGSGKTMVAIVPALLEKDYITVIYLPFVALLQEYAQKLRAMSVDFELYSPPTPLQGRTNLILVSADQHNVDHWREAILRVHFKRRVVRQIVDEAHVPLLSEDFRPALRDMGDMRCAIPSQVIILSGTIPVSMQSRLASDYMMGRDCVIIRAPTNRPELVYDWRKPLQESALVSVIESLVKHHLRAPEDRGLIFVPSKPLGYQLQKTCDRPFYSADLRPEDRQTMSDAWRSGIHPVMVCTSAFGTGNDYAYVRLVIHAGNPHEMISYVQEISRAGRDGKPAHCILLPLDGNRSLPQGDFLDYAGKKYLYKALNAPGPPSCIRYTITSFVDTQGTRCSTSEANQPCSVCFGARKHALDQSSTPASPLKRPFLTAFEGSSRQAREKRQLRLTTETRYVHDFKKALALYSRACAFCTFFDIPSSYHSIMSCSTLNAKYTIQNYKVWKNSINYNPKVKVCYYCWVPQCNDALHPPFEKNPDLCPDPDKVAPIVFAILNDRALVEEASAHFHVNLSVNSQWLRELPTPTSTNSNVAELFLWYHGRCPL